MVESIRFYMDEHVPRAVTEGLRRRGVGVLTVHEAGMWEAGDPDLVSAQGGACALHCLTGGVLR